MTFPFTSLPITGWWAELSGAATATITPTPTAAGSLPSLALATITPAPAAVGFLTVFKGAAATITPTPTVGGSLSLQGTAAATVTLTAGASGTGMGDAAATITPTAANAGFLAISGTAAATVTPAPSVAGSGTGVAAVTVTPTPSAAGHPAGTAPTTVTPAPAAAGLLTPNYDNSAISARQVSLASGSPFTWSSGGGAAGAYGLVFVACQSGVMDLATTTAAVTWGGSSMTSLGSAYNTSATTTQGWGWVFALNGIPGGAQTISVTLTESGKTFTGYGSSYSYANVSSVGTLQTAHGGTGVNPSVAVTAANATDIVWGAITTNVVALSGFSLTARQDNNTAALPPVFWAGDTTGSTSVTVTGTAAAQWSAFGLDLK